CLLACHRNAHRVGRPDEAPHLLAFRVAGNGPETPGAAWLDSNPVSAQLGVGDRVALGARREGSDTLVGHGSAHVGPLGLTTGQQDGPLKPANDGITRRRICDGSGKSATPVFASFSVMQQVSELMSNPEVEVIGLLPAELQQMTTYSAGATMSARQAEAAKALIKALTAPSAAPIYKAKGLDPPWEEGKS